MIRQYYDIHANKFHNSEVLEKFLEKLKLPKQKQEEKNLTISMSIKKLKL